MRSECWSVMLIVTLRRTAVLIMIRMLGACGCRGDQRAGKKERLHDKNTITNNLEQTEDGLNENQENMILYQDIRL